jgi:hypothetical protein
LRVQVVKLLTGQLKHKICRETLTISFDLFIKPAGGDIVKTGKIRIEDDLLIAYPYNFARCGFCGNQGDLCFCHSIPSFTKLLLRTSGASGGSVFYLLSST